MPPSLPKAFPCFTRTAHQPIRSNLLASTRSPPRRPLSLQCPHFRPLQHSSTTRRSSPRASTLPSSSCAFHSTPARAYKTVQEARSRNRSGPFSATAALVFLTAGAGMIFYFRFEKARVERQRVAEAAKGVGKPKVGGAFELVDQDGRVFTEVGMKGRFSLVYFGFTHCPDICPEELDKMAHMIDLVSGPSSTTSPQGTTPSSPTTAGPPNTSVSTPASTAASASSSQILPIFITCDPARDTPAVIKSYLAEFHPAMIGLTGTWEQVKAVCKAYRVYFSTPPNVKPGQDYLVDHSIYFYLMDPEGDFVEAIGRQHSAERAAKIISEHMGDWKDGVKKS